MPDGLEKIGLEAIIQTAQFQDGMKIYLDGVVRMESETERAAREAARATEEMARKQEAALKKIGLAFAAVGAAGVALLGKLALTASRAEELGVILDVTAVNARRLAEEQARLAEAEGDQAAAAEAAAKAAALTVKAVNAQVQAVKDLGITTAEASKTVALLIRYNLDWQKATDLARLAQDAATFAAQDSSEALAGLIHGITTLNVRVLRTYGIMVSLEQEYAKFSEQTGRSTNDLSAAEKQTIAFNAVLAQAPAIAGAYEAAMETASKQIRSLKRDITDVSEEFGQALTPALTGAIGGLRDLLHWLRDLPDPMQATVSTTLAMAAGLTTLLGAAILVIPKIIEFRKALQDLVILQRIAAAGLLGPIGILAGLTTLAALAITYGSAMERAHRQEAAALLEAGDSYDRYKKKAEDAGLGSYALSESLYDVARAAIEAGEQLDLLKLQEARQDVLELLSGTQYLDQGLDEVTERLAKQARGLSDYQLTVLGTKEELVAWALQMGYSKEEAAAFAAAVVELTEAEEWRRQEIENAIALDEERDRLLKQAEAQHKKTQDAVEDEAGAMTVYSDALEAATLDRRLLTAAELAAADIHAEVAREIDANAKQAARAMIEAEKGADEDRERARQQLLDDQEALEERHGEAVAKILKDLARVDKDLLADRVKAEERAVQERIDANDELGRALARADEKLAAEREEAHADYLQKLGDLDRKYAQDREDLGRDLDRDLEGLHRDHLDKLADLDADYFRDREKLAEDHSRRLASIEERYASEAAAIRAKFRGKGAERDFDAEREALQKQLDALKNQRGIDYSQERAEVQKRLDDLEQAELAALEERKQAELDELAKWLAEQQSVQDQAHQAAIDAENAAYEKQKAERRRQFDERLEDLRIQEAREREEARLGEERALADLQAAHQAERDEAQRRYRERLAEIDVQLAQEQQRLDEAAKQERARLGEQLAAEEQSYKDRFAKLEEAHQDRLDEIDRALEAEKTEIETKALEATLLYLDAMKSLGPDTRKELERQAVEDLRPALDQWVKEFEDAGRRAQEAVAAMTAGIETETESQSPSRWARRIAESIGQGWEQGDTLGPALAAMLDQVVGFKREAGAAFQGIQPVTASPAAAAYAPALMPPQITYQPPALPSMAGPSNVSTDRSTHLNLTAHYAREQSEASIWDDLQLLQLKLAARGRIR